MFNSLFAVYNHTFHSERKQARTNEPTNELTSYILHENTPSSGTVVKHDRVKKIIAAAGVSKTI